MASEMLNPGALAGATGARVSTDATAGKSEDTRKARKPGSRVLLHKGDGDRVVTVTMMQFLEGAA